MLTQKVLIKSLDYEGCSIVHAADKAIFIEGALTGERVAHSSDPKKASFDLTQIVQIIKLTFMRTGSSVRRVIKNGKRWLASIRSAAVIWQVCSIVKSSSKIAQLLPLLVQMEERLSICQTLPQIKMAVGEYVDVLVVSNIQGMLYKPHWQEYLAAWPESKV